VTDEDLRRSNPKYPTLVGYKMASLWNYILIERGQVAAQQKLLSRYKQSLRHFRERWAYNRPRTEEQWSQFWLDYKHIEDMLEDVQNGLSEIREELHLTATEGLEIVNQNGVDTAGDPLDEMTRLLDRAREQVNAPR
jgi:hypothetical protein